MRGARLSPAQQRSLATRRRPRKPLARRPGTAAKGAAWRVVPLVVLLAAATLLEPLCARVQAGDEARGRPTSPLVVAQTQLLGLPKLRQYEPIGELRDVHYDFGKAAIRPADVAILDANAAWLRANPNYLLLIEGHCDSQGPASRKNELRLRLRAHRGDETHRVGCRAPGIAVWGGSDEQCRQSRGSRHCRAIR
jgi:outer membrane protein OmpA-like peptidoglycan-associated protein